MQGIAEVEAICERAMLARAEAHMNEQEREPTPLECHESCGHACACRRQYERTSEPIVDNDWREWLPEALGCDECDEYEDWRDS